MGVFADKFGSEQQPQEWLISFYEKQLSWFFNNMGRTTEHGVKVTPRLIRATMRRYSQLLEKFDVTDWEQS